MLDYNEQSPRSGCRNVGRNFGDFDSLKLSRRANLVT